MATRSRYELIAATSKPYEQLSFYSTVGTCAADPGPSDGVYWGAHNASGNTQVLLKERSMEDVVTPGFAKLKAKGMIVNNPMESVYTEVSEDIVDVHYEYLVSVYGCTPVRLYPYQRGLLRGTRSVSSLYGSDVYLSATDIDIESMKDRAISQAHARVGHDQILGLSALAEANTTIVGLTDVFKKVGKISAAIKSKRYKILKDKRNRLTYSDLEELYMNARYNLRPLYYDVKAMIKILQERNVIKPERLTFRASLTEHDYASEGVSKSYFYQSAANNVNIDFVRHCTQDVTVRAGVLTHAELPKASQILGFDSIVESLWDLTPYSFILDWFFNVGDTIMAWTPVMGFKTLASWITVEETVIQKTSITGMTVNHGVNGTYTYSPIESSIGYGSTSRLVRKKTRIPDYQRPFIPSWDMNLDALKLLDLGLIIKNVRKNATYVKTG